MKALAPARVREVRIDQDTGTAEVIVPDFQLSLAIGKEGQNARLAARLTRLARRHQERDASSRGGVRRRSSTPRASGSRTSPASSCGSRPKAARRSPRPRPATRHRTRCRVGDKPRAAPAAEDPTAWATSPRHAVPSHRRGSRSPRPSRSARRSRSRRRRHPSPKPTGARRPRGVATESRRGDRHGDRRTCVGCRRAAPPDGAGAARPGARTASSTWTRARAGAPGCAPPATSPASTRRLRRRALRPGAAESGWHRTAESEKRLRATTGTTKPPDRQ